MSTTAKVRIFDDIYQNIKTAERIRRKSTGLEFDGYKKAIQMGQNFLPYSTKSNGIGFIPAEIAAYQDNFFFGKEESIEDRSGVISEAVINAFMRHHPKFNSDLESKFLELCNTIGVTNTKLERKYWNVINLTDIW